jgi:LmbE family N-acetylglucosaminyl deacetylase
VFLDFPDVRLAEYVPQAVDEVVNLILSTGANVIYAPHPGEYHPDHRAANKIARLAAWNAMYLHGHKIEFNSQVCFVLRPLFHTDHIRVTKTKLTNAM